MKKIVGKLLGDVLVKAGALTPEKLEQALQMQRKTGGYLGEILLNSGFITEKTFAYALSLQYGQNLPFMNLNKYKLTPEVVKLVPKEFVNRYKVMPVDRFRDILTLAIANPESIDGAIEKLAELTGMKIEVLLTTTEQLNKAIAKYF